MKRFGALRIASPSEPASAIAPPQGFEVPPMHEPRRLVKTFQLHPDDGKLLVAEQKSADAGLPTIREAVEVEVNHGRGVECERVTKDEAADDSYNERASQFGAHAGR